MTELTLEQWKERALVAEALLEERTQECEKLRAEAEIAKEGTATGRIKSGDKFTIQGMPGEYIVLDEFFSGDQWSPEQLRKMMEQTPEWYRVPIERKRPGRIPFRTPMDDFTVIVEEQPHNGETRVSIHREGMPDLAVAFRRGGLQSQDPIRTARMIARDCATKWYLDTRQEDSLATLIHERIKDHLRGGKRRGYW